MLEDVRAMVVQVRALPSGTIRSQSSDTLAAVSRARRVRDHCHVPSLTRGESGESGA